MAKRQKSSLNNLNNSPEDNAFAAAFSALLSDTHPDCRVRLAPTPSGFLHIGNALNFVLNTAMAFGHGGKIFLRIDDIDADRKRPEYVADIFESLHWLGLNRDEGPGLLSSNLSAQVADFEQNWSQHRRLHLSESILTRLRDMDLLFACRLSRSQLAAYGGAYPAHLQDQGLSLDDPDVAWRVKTEGLPPSIQHFIVRRRDGLPAYQVASLADDLHFGVTHIIRGADLEPSTQAQLYLAKLLGEARFLIIKFLHHPLLTDETGQKLSKSAGATSLQAMREEGRSAAVVYQTIASFLGLAPCNNLPSLHKQLIARI